MTHINTSLDNKDMDSNFEKKIKQTLDANADSLNAQTLQRLRIARETALEKTPKHFVLPSLNIKWISGFALASLLAFMVIPNLTLVNKQENTLALLDSIFIENTELLDEESELELYTQLDFYQWLDEADL